MTERGFKGVWIPKEIWLHPGLTLQEKILLVEIDSLDNEHGCFANNKHFADFLNIGERRVQALVKSLKEKGYLSVSFLCKGETKEIGGRILKVLSPPYPLPPGVVKEAAPGGEENFAGVVKEAAPGGEGNFAPYIRIRNTELENQDSIPPQTPRREAATGKQRSGEDLTDLGGHPTALAQKAQAAGSGVTEITKPIRNMPPGARLAGFQKFWQAYPRKKSKATAERAWAKIHPDEQLQRQIMEAIDRAKQSRDWQKEGGQYIPYPATWLNARGWEDEPEPDGSPAVVSGKELSFSEIAQRLARGEKL